MHCISSIHVYFKLKFDVVICRFYLLNMLANLTKKTTTKEPLVYSFVRLNTKQPGALIHFAKNDRAFNSQKQKDTNGISLVFILVQ